MIEHVGAEIERDEHALVDVVEVNVRDEGARCVFVELVARMGDEEFRLCFSPGEADALARELTDRGDEVRQLLTAKGPEGGSFAGP